MALETILATTAAETVRTGRITSSAVCPRNGCGWLIFTAPVPDEDMVSSEASKHDAKHRAEDEADDGD